MNAERGPRPAWALIALGLAAAALVAGFAALGIWQVQRRGWKHDLIARVDARVHAAAVAPPGPAGWPVTKDVEYRRIALSGRYLPGRDTYVQAATARGPGFWLVTPFAADAGFVVLVNRGFVPDRRPVPASAVARVTGLLRLSEPGGGFLRRNDPPGDRWHSRDVAAIAAARGLRGTAPYFVDADAQPGEVPVGGLTVIRFPDNHLVYAVTWFALAAMVAGGYLVLMRHESRLRRDSRSAG